MCIVARRGARVTQVRLTVERDRLVRPGWTLYVEGLDDCRKLLDAVKLDYQK